MRSVYALLANDRGQTLQDYALGITLFLATVFFVVGFIVPTMLAPFQADVGGDSEAQAERVVSTLVQNASVSGSLNELNVTIVENVVSMDTDGLRTRYRIPNTSWINVSFRTLDGSVVLQSESGQVLATEESAEGAQTATQSRIVMLSDGTCDPACRLVVRAW